MSIIQRRGKVHVFRLPVVEAIIATLVWANILLLHETCLGLKFSSVLSRRYGGLPYLSTKRRAAFCGNFYERRARAANLYSTSSDSDEVPPEGPRFESLYQEPSDSRSRDIYARRDAVSGPAPPPFPRSIPRGPRPIEQNGDSLFDANKLTPVAPREHLVAVALGANSPAAVAAGGLAARAASDIAESVAADQELQEQVKRAMERLDGGAVPIEQVYHDPPSVQSTATPHGIASNFAPNRNTLTVQELKAMIEEDTKYGRWQSAVEAWQKYIESVPSSSNYLEYAKWAEDEVNQIVLARSIYESMVTKVNPKELKKPWVLGAWALFEEKHGEHERAQLIRTSINDMIGKGELGFQVATLPEPIGQIPENPQQDGVSETIVLSGIAEPLNKPALLDTSQEEDQEDGDEEAVHVEKTLPAEDSAVLPRHEESHEVPSTKPWNFFGKNRSSKTKGRNYSNVETAENSLSVGLAAAALLSAVSFGVLFDGFHSAPPQNEPTSVGRAIRAEPVTTLDTSENSQEARIEMNHDEVTINSVDNQDIAPIDGPETVKRTEQQSTKAVEEVDEESVGSNLEGMDEKTLPKKPYNEDGSYIGTNDKVETDTEGKKNDKDTSLQPPIEKQTQADLEERKELGDLLTGLDGNVFLAHSNALSDRFEVLFRSAKSSQKLDAIKLIELDKARLKLVSNSATDASEDGAGSTQGDGSNVADTSATSTSNLVTVNEDGVPEESSALADSNPGERAVVRTESLDMLDITTPIGPMGEIRSIDLTKIQGVTIGRVETPEGLSLASTVAPEVPPGPGIITPRQEDDELRRKEAELAKLLEEQQRMENELQRRLDDDRKREQEEFKEEEMRIAAIKAKKQEELSRKEEDLRRKEAELQKKMEEQQRREAERQRRLDEKRIMAEERARKEEELRIVEEKARKEEQLRMKEEELRRKEVELRIKIDEQRKIEEQEQAQIEELRKQEQELRQKAAERQKQEEERQNKLEQERQRKLEEERKVEEQKARIQELRREQEELRRRVEEQQRLEEERRGAEEAIRREEEIRTADEIQRLEQERIAAEETAKQEELRLAAEKLKEAEQNQKKLDEERQEAIENAKREELRLAEEKLQKAEEIQRKLEEDRQIAANMAKEEELRASVEKAQKEEELRMKVAELQKKMEEQRLLEDERQRKQEEVRKASEEKARKEEELRAAVEKVQKEEEVRTRERDLQKKIEEQKQEDARQRKLEEERKAEVIRLEQEKAKKDEELRIAEEKAQREEELRISREAAKKKEELRSAQEKSKKDEDLRIAQEKSRQEAAVSAIRPTAVLEDTQLPDLSPAVVNTVAIGLVAALGAVGFSAISNDGESPPSGKSGGKSKDQKRKVDVEVTQDRLWPSPPGSSSRGSSINGQRQKSASLSSSNDGDALLQLVLFETRCGRFDRAEDAFKKYVKAFPSVSAYLRFADWAENDAVNIKLARSVFESMLTELDPEEVDQASIFKQWAAFEERQGEFERAQIIYQGSSELVESQQSSSGYNGGGNANQGFGQETNSQSGFNGSGNNSGRQPGNDALGSGINQPFGAESYYQGNYEPFSSRIPNVGGGGGASAFTPDPPESMSGGAGSFGGGSSPAFAQQNGANAVNTNGQYNGGNSPAFTQQNGMNGGMNGAPLNGGMNGTPMNGGMNGTPINGGMSGTPINGGMNGTPMNGGMNGTPMNGGMNGIPMNGGINGTPMNGGINGTPTNGGMNGGVSSYAAGSGYQPYGSQTISNVPGTQQTPGYNQNFQPSDQAQFNNYGAINGSPGVNQQQASIYGPNLGNPAPTGLFDKPQEVQQAANPEPVYPTLQPAYPPAAPPVSAPAPAPPAAPPSPGPSLTPPPQTATTTLESRMENLNSELLSRSVVNESEDAVSLAQQALNLAEEAMHMTDSTSSPELTDEMTKAYKALSQMLSDEDSKQH